LAAGSVKYRSIRKEAVGRNILINSTPRIEFIYTNIILSKASILLDVDFSIPIHGPQLRTHYRCKGYRLQVKFNIRKVLEQTSH
jgi:hypothetical protein